MIHLSCLLSIFFWTKESVEKLPLEPQEILSGNPPDPSDLVSRDRLRPPPPNGFRTDVEIVCQFVDRKGIVHVGTSLSKQG